MGMGTVARRDWRQESQKLTNLFDKATAGFTRAKEHLKTRSELTVPSILEEDIEGGNGDLPIDSGCLPEGSKVGRMEQAMGSLDRLDSLLGVERRTA